MIRFNCPTCGMAVSAPKECAGRSTKCRYCNNPIVVPQLASPSAVQQPRATPPLSHAVPRKVKKPAKPATVPQAQETSKAVGVSRVTGTTLIKAVVIASFAFAFVGIAGLILYAYLESRETSQPSKDVALRMNPRTTNDASRPSHVETPATPHTDDEPPPSGRPIRPQPRLSEQPPVPSTKEDHRNPSLARNEKSKTPPITIPGEIVPSDSAKTSEHRPLEPTPKPKLEKRTGSEPPSDMKEPKAPNNSQSFEKKEPKQEKRAVPGLDSSFDDEDTSKTVVSVGKRIKEASEEELRKELLAAVPEVGLNQESAAEMYGTLVPAQSQDRSTRSRASASLPSIGPVAPPPDYGPKFFVQWVKRKGRSELSNLPWRKVPDCQLGKEPAETLNDLSVSLRACLGNATQSGHVRPDAEIVQRLLTTPNQLRTPQGTIIVNKPDEWRKPAAIPALMQLLQVENAPIRLLLVELLKEIEGEEASTALALRALFDLSPQVRERAVQALTERPFAEFRHVLVKAFNYPWREASIHAANALMVLKDPATKDKSLLPALVDLLREPNPLLPFTVEIEKKSGEMQKTWAVRGLVRMNHMCNCMVCHAPSTSDKDMVRGRVPIPNEDPPPLYYAERSGLLFVRADTTFLRQDFSVVQPVARSGKWPGDQRFDYVVRVRPLTEKEKTEFEKMQKEKKEPGTFVQKEALLFTIRELTGKNLGSSYEDWKPLLKTTAGKDREMP